MSLANYKDTGSDKLFNIIIMITLVTIFVLILYPLVYIVSASFSSPLAIIQGKVKLLPVDFSLDGYKEIFSHKSIVYGFFNSIFYMVTATSLNLILTVLVAYPLSRKDFKYKKWFILPIVFTMIFNPGLIPNYLLIKNLNLVNKRLVLILPKAINAWNVMIAITFFKTNIPDELLESAKIDGCNDFQFIPMVVLPLSKAIIAVMALFYAVEHWNAYFDAMIYLTDKIKFPIQLVMRDILISNQITMEMAMIADPQTLMIKENLAILLKYSLIVVSTFPVMIIYPFVQKHFVKGVMMGSVKG